MSHARSFPILLLSLLAACSGKDDAADTPDAGAADADGDGSVAREDCDDTVDTVHPDADEYCNGIDDDCDGVTDEGAVDQLTWYTDDDGDGAGDPAYPTLGCEATGGRVASGDDCDDTDGDVHPGAVEVCDVEDVDEDCNGTADDADQGVDLTGATTWYADADGDGFGDPDAGTARCDIAEGEVALAEDCDDADRAVHPDATEVCDAGDVDEDCDGAADDADADVDLAAGGTWYADADGDGYGDAAAGTVACDATASEVENADDCDDGDAAIHPAANESCDEADVDEDCDGLADDADEGALGPSTWYADADGDGYGDAGVLLEACDLPAGHTTDAADCDDGYATVYPGAPDQCDGQANDCDQIASWTAEGEAGIVSWIDAAGAWTVVTADFAGGTESSPTAWVAAADGELRFCDGTWYATLDTSGSSVAVASLNGAGVTRIDAADAGSVVRSVGGVLTVEGLTLSNGAAASGGGVYCLATDLVVRDAVISDSTATSYGAGIYLSGCAAAEVTATELRGNAGSSGGGLHAANSDGLVLQDLLVESNTATVSGGGVSFSNSDFTLTDSEIAGNTSGAAYSGGGVAVSESTGTLAGVVVSTNEAGTAAGLMLSESVIGMSDSEISGNVSSSYAAAAHAYLDSTLTLERTIVSGNVAGDSYGTFFLDRNVTGTFTDCTFTDNSGAEAGVFAFSDTATATVVTSDFSGNTPNDALAFGVEYTFGAATSVVCSDTAGCI